MSNSSKALEVKSMATPGDLCVCCLLRALDIIDYGKRCREYLFRKSPEISWALSSLETLAEEFKTRTDRSGVEYDTYPLYYFLKELPMSLPFQSGTTSLNTRLKYLYFKRKLVTFLRGDLFNAYIDVVKKNLEDCAASIESVTEKFLKVCRVLRLQPELSSQDVVQYEFMADLLRICHERNIQSCQLVVKLVKMTISRFMSELCDTRHVRQPAYPQRFFSYILELCKEEKFDLAAFCRLRPRTLWEYSMNFSVHNAVSYGNKARTLCLLQHGFEVFSENEVRIYGHGFPFVEETIPSTHLMIFQMMSSMRSVNLFIFRATHIYYNRLYTLTQDQKECFRLIWQAIPTPFVKHHQMARAITHEYFHLANNSVFNPMRFEKNSKLCVLYGTCFPDLSSGPTKPRSLKHLSRCAVRERLRENWCLPKGIFLLGLPETLERYLNLEV